MHGRHNLKIRCLRPHKFLSKAACGGRLWIPRHDIKHANGAKYFLLVLSGNPMEWDGTVTMCHGPGHKKVSLGQACHMLIRKGAHRNFLRGGGGWSFEKNILLSLKYRLPFFYNIYVIYAISILTHQHFSWPGPAATSVLLCPFSPVTVILLIC